MKFLTLLAFILCAAQTGASYAADTTDDGFGARFTSYSASAFDDSANYIAAQEGASSAEALADIAPAAGDEMAAPSAGGEAVQNSKSLTASFEESVSPQD